MKPEVYSSRKIIIVKNELIKFYCDQILCYTCITLVIVVCVLSDCGSPSADTGYVIDSSTGTTIDSTASLSCQTGYTGSPSDIVCELTGWSTQSGCTRGKWCVHLILSHNIATGDWITPLFKIDKPLVVYAFSMLWNDVDNTAAYIITKSWCFYAKIARYLCNI